FRLVHPHEVMRIHIVELEARALVEHVGVDPVGAEQRDALLALRALLLQPLQLGRQRDDLLVQFLPCIEAVFARIGIDAEIADQCCRHRIEGKPGQERFESGTRNHGESWGYPVKASLTRATRSNHLFCLSTKAAKAARYCCRTARSDSLVNSPLSSKASPT